jgi:hypothetical protein
MWIFISDEKEKSPPQNQKKTFTKKIITITSQGYSIQR